MQVYTEQSVAMACDDLSQYKSRPILYIEYDVLCYY